MTDFDIMVKSPCEIKSHLYASVPVNIDNIYDLIYTRAARLIIKILQPSFKNSERAVVMYRYETASQSLFNQTVSLFQKII